MATRNKRSTRVPLRTLLILWLVTIGCKPCSSQAIAQEHPFSYRSLAEKLGIEIATGGAPSPVRTRFGQITLASADRDALEKYQPLLCGEFAIYSPNLLVRAGLKRIVLCEQLAFMGQLRNAVPDFESGTLYLEVKRGQHNTRYLRRVMHHDFFHMIDYRDDGSLYQDDLWCGLNPKDFKYGKGGQSAQDQANTAVLSDRYPGFLNHYSTTGVEEDKAEIFAWMIVEPDIMAERQADPTLAAKMDRIKQLMRGFSADADDRFWQTARSIRR